MSLRRLTGIVCAVLGASVLVAGRGGGSAVAPPVAVAVATNPSPVAPRPTAAANPLANPTSPPAEGAWLQDGAALRPGMVPDPGAVGFLGDVQSLRVIDGSGPVPAGATWTPGVLRVDGDNVMLDHVYVKGGVDFYGHGVLTIRDSIVEGDEQSWSPVMGRSLGSRLDIRDSTIRYRTGAPPPGPVWNNGVLQGDSMMTVIRCDLSGTPTGVQNGPGNSRYEQNYVHGMKLLGSYPTETHNDGLQSYGGSGLVIADNRIDIRSPDGTAYDGLHQTSAIFVQPSVDLPSAGLRIDGNYLVGGGYALHLEAPADGVVVVHNTFGPTTGGFGHAVVDKGVAVASWQGNVDEQGVSVLPG